MTRAEPQIVPSQAALADALGMSESQVSRCVRREGFPRNKDGSFDVEKARAWIEKRKAERNGKTPAMIAADLRYREARAKDLQLTVKTKAAALISVEQAAADVIERDAFFRPRLAAIARKLTSKIARTDNPAEVQALLDQEFDSLLWAAYEHGSEKNPEN